MVSPRRTQHPLCGSDLLTLLAVLREAGGVDRRALGALATVFAAVLARLPFTLGERLAVAAAARRNGPVPPPVFIVGHWRSGTTHLYNVMAKGDFGVVTPIAAGLPCDFLGLGRLARPILHRSLPEHRYIDNVAVTPEAPQEDEIGLANLTKLSYYHALYFPKHFDELFDRGVFFDGCDEKAVLQWQQRLRGYLFKVWLDQNRRPLLVKNPVYTARLARLKAMWPEAKFIHVVRNPLDVFLSMRNFYAKLFPPLALQAWDAVDIDEVVLGTFDRMMAAYRAQAPAMPPGDLVEVRYEDLDRAPMATLERVYAALGLPGFDEARPNFAAYLDAIRQYEKNRFAVDPKVVALVRERWADHIAHWGYGEAVAARGG